MSGFLDPLNVTEIDVNVFMVIDHDFRYQSDLIKEVITVPIGFKTDFESMVRWVPTFYSILADRARASAVVHDFLYYAGKTTQEMADDILFEAMGIEGVSNWYRYPIWWGLRIGGWKAWNDHRMNRDRTQDTPTKFPVPTSLTPTTLVEP